VALPDLCCHWDKGMEPRRAREQREWLRREEAAESEVRLGVRPGDDGVALASVVSFALDDGPLLQKPPFERTEPTSALSEIGGFV
jgi:hypothetical protein